MRLNAPRTPSDRATTTGTPYFGSPYRNGPYASDVQGEAKALCHVSDLGQVNLDAQCCGKFLDIPEASEAIRQIKRTEQCWTTLVSNDHLYTGPDDL